MSTPTLNESEAKALADLKARLSSEATADEKTLLRFLVAREFSVEDAYRQYMATWEWRKNNDIDHLLDSEQPLTKKLKHILSYAHHKFDKEGRPCYIEKTGRTDVPALLKLPQDQLIRWHVWNTEKQIQQMKEKSVEMEKDIETLVHIHDLSGASLRMRKSVHLFARLAKLDQEYYPERMGKVFIVNTPWIFPVLWKVSRSFLDVKTRNKCVFLSTAEVHRLLDYFNPEDLPEEYGGTCHCEYGCMPEVPKHMLLSTEHPQLTEECIAPRKTFSFKFECKGNQESIGWFYRVSQKDVKFGVSFVEQCDKEKKNCKEVWVVEPDYPLHSTKPNIGFHTCTTPGTYTLVWDNSSSRFLSRTLKYHVMTADQHGAANGGEDMNGSSRSSSLESVEL